ncbi:MAG: NAD(+)/NADH kinase [Capsulimonadaceae bacterium]|nr:NAD(+)/NADH kinase [Capsulimonadaceae bacterium]
MIKVRRIGVVANSDKPIALEYARTAVLYLASRVDKLLLQAEIAASSGNPELAADVDDVCDADVVLIFGGDGTMLRAARACVPRNAPMLGINVGRFGFLNDVAPENLIQVLDRLLLGQYQISERLTLECIIKRGDQIVGSDTALNEIVIAHGKLARVLHLRINLNNAFLTHYTADGVMVATPTGSTAYSLSAGGPLVHPSIKTMLLTPICPHTLINRALLVPEQHEITISVDVSDGDNIQATVDGQRGLPMDKNDVAIIRRCPTPARLVTHVGGALFYEKLQTKLHWGEA